MAKFKNRMNNTSEGLGTFSPVPAGTYTAKVVESEIKKTKAGDGEYMKFAWEIVKGKFKGRKIYDNVNFNNPNATAQEIAEKTIVSMCEACGVKPSKFNNTDQLHGKPCTLKVGVEEDEKGKYDPQNRVNNILPLEKGEKGKKGKKGKGKGKKKPSWA